MRNKLHDGPSETFQILNGRMKRQSEKPRASLDALQWAAERAGQSYGVFTLNLCRDEEEKIQLEYDDMIRQRKVEMAQRAVKRVEISTGTDDFIITDDGE
jgi:Cdc6-like AAA superfamily ATPase